MCLSLCLHYFLLGVVSRSLICSLACVSVAVACALICMLPALNDCRQVPRRHRDVLLVLLLLPLPLVCLLPTKAALMFSQKNRCLRLLLRLRVRQQVTVGIHCGLGRQHIYIVFPLYCNCFNNANGLLLLNFTCSSHCGH